MNTHPAILPSPQTDGEFRTRVTGRTARLIPLALVALAVGVLVTDAGPVPAAAVVGVVSVAVWALLDVQLVAGPRGFELAVAAWRWPRVRVPLSSIERVDVEAANPLTYGGWGYRVRPGVRAVLIRRGPAVRLVRRGRPDLVVTVPEAQQVADVLERHLAP